jgi:hypothetical protein
MGMVCWTTCEDCDEKAPELGDSGFMGYPSLDDKVTDVDVATFGSIYKALAAVHAITGEVDAFHKFLERHRGHNVVTDTEDGPAFGGDDDMDEMDELYDDDDFEDEDDTGFEEDFEDDDIEETSDESLLHRDNGAVDSYVRAKYQATCTQCNVSFLTKHSEDFVPFDRTTITAKAMKMYQRHVVDVMDESSYRAEPLYDGDLEELALFFEDHRRHEVVVEIVPQNS